MCPECNSGDIAFFRRQQGVDIWKCNTCGEEFVRQEDVE